MYYMRYFYNYCINYYCYCKGRSFLAGIDVVDPTTLLESIASKNTAEIINYSTIIITMLITITAIITETIDDDVVDGKRLICRGVFYTYFLQENGGEIKLFYVRFFT